MGETIATRFGADAARRRSSRRRSTRSTCRAPRVAPPDALAHALHDDPDERAGHTYGKSFRDVVRGAAPRLLAARPTSSRSRATRPTSSRCSTGAATRGVAAIPYGGGSSVVGGVECDVDDDYRGAVSIDLRALDRVLEVDRVSRAARIQAGMLGPALEDQLRPHGLTLRHFPQSFEFSTLGGWLATRSGGHYATLHTHIDDFVESIRAVTPRGVWESRRLPGLGRRAVARPPAARLGGHRSASSPRRGCGCRTGRRSARRPPRASPTFAARRRGGARDRAVRPATRRTAGCSTRSRRSSPAPTTAATRCCSLAFESADHPLDAWIARAVECARDHGGTRRRRRDRRSATARRRPARAKARPAAWRNAFLRAPYTRDALVGARHDQRDVRDRVHVGSRSTRSTTRSRPRCSTPPRPRARGPRSITCRFTHVYPDGPAPYFTVLALGQRGRAARAVGGDQGRGRPTRSSDHGGTITHHHAVGRDHRRWYDRQRPELFAAALRAAKRALDPGRHPQPRRADRPMTGVDRYRRGDLRPRRRRVPVAVRGVRRVRPSTTASQPGTVRALIRRAARPARGPRSNGASSTMDEFYAALEAEAARRRLRARRAPAHGHDRPRLRSAARDGRARSSASARPGCAPPRSRTTGPTPTTTRRRRTATRLGFDVIVESAVEGLRKPDPRIYELVLARLDVDAPRRVFLDDLGINLKPARAMGMTTIKVVDPDDALAELATVTRIRGGADGAALGPARRARTDRARHRRARRPALTDARPRAGAAARRLARVRADRRGARRARMRRAVETAAPIAAALGLEVEIVDGLIEYDAQLRPLHPDGGAARQQGRALDRDGRRPLGGVRRRSARRLPRARRRRRSTDDRRRASRASASSRCATAA